MLFNSSKVESAGLDEVRLTGGPFLLAMERESSYLLNLDADRLLSHFRFTAGLDSTKPRYVGWEVREVRGHSLGHYLSACSMMYASAGVTLLKNKLFVNLFIPTVLSIPSDRFTLTQETSFPEEGRTTIRLKLDKPSFFELNLRIPEWIGEEYSIVFKDKHTACNT